MARTRLPLLAALCLLISVLALHVEARPLPDCGPLAKFQRCDKPPLITRSVQANVEQLSPTDIHEASSNIQGDDSTHAAPAKAHELKKAIANSSTSGAAHDGVEGDTSKCGPLSKNPYRCGNPPRIRVRDINVLG